MGRKGQNNRNVDKKQTTNAETSKIPSSKNRKSLDRLVDRLLKEVAIQISNDKLWDVFVAVNDILEEIKSLEYKTEPKDVNNRNAAIESFINWLENNGVKNEGLSICEFPGFELGLKACKNFKRGDMILHVPRKVMLAEDCAKESKLGNLISNDPILKHMPNVSLSMYLLLQKFSSGSFWKPYIDVLPATYSTVLYFTPDDFQHLKGSPVLKPALKLCLNIARQFAYFYKLLHCSSDPVAREMKGRFSYNEYRWAVSTVMTRQNLVPPSQGKAVTAETERPQPLTVLIPLWDMCNHTRGEITTDFNDEKDQAECFALQDFKDGEQIFIFYGVRTNAFFFLHNGFVYDENEHDSLSLSLGVSSGDPLHPLKRQLLEKLGLATVEFSLLGGTCPVTSALMAFARIALMDKDQLTDSISNGHHGDLMELNKTSDAYSDLDKKAFLFINTRCKLLLQTYQQYFNTNPDTTGELTAEMNNLKVNGRRSKISPKQRNLVRQLKRSEMMILQNAVNYTQQRI